MITYLLLGAITLWCIAASILSYKAYQRLVTSISAIHAKAVNIESKVQAIAGALDARPPASPSIFPSIGHVHEKKDGIWHPTHVHVRRDTEAWKKAMKAKGKALLVNGVMELGEQ